MVKKALRFCLVAVLSMLLSIAGGCMAILAFAGGGTTTLGYLMCAAIIWIAGTAVTVLSIIAIVYYLTHATRPHYGNQPSPNQGNGHSSNNSLKGR